ncbi:hypothetical protein T492DRAFT_1124011 [Pavlovales sp. CCMP2436]|nr:hypothetical protein T492DRAFT_1124011 [Pavlovales sp. CCMP2436]
MYRIEINTYFSLASTIEINTSFSLASTIEINTSFSLASTIEINTSFSVASSIEIRVLSCVQYSNSTDRGLCTHTFIYIGSALVVVGSVGALLCQKIISIVVVGSVGALLYYHSWDSHSYKYNYSALVVVGSVGALVFFEWYFPPPPPPLPTPVPPPPPQVSGAEFIAMVGALLFFNGARTMGLEAQPELFVLDPSSELIEAQLSSSDDGSRGSARTLRAWYACLIPPLPPHVPVTAVLAGLMLWCSEAGKPATGTPKRKSKRAAD